MKKNMGIVADSLRKEILGRAPALLQAIRDNQGEDKLSASRRDAATGLLRKVMTPAQINAAVDCLPPAKELPVAQDFEWWMSRFRTWVA